MLRFLTKPKHTIASHVVLLFAPWSVGGFVLSDGWLRIDSSAHRDLLYTLMTKVIPVAVNISVVHVTATIARPRVWAASLLVGLLLGATGPLLLHLSIIASDDPVADMAYLSLVQSYSVFFVITFLTSCAVFSRLQRRIGEKTGEPGAAPNASSL